jgi:hypothetical protein
MKYTGVKTNRAFLSYSFTLIYSEIYLEGWKIGLSKSVFHLAKSTSLHNLVLITDIINDGCQVKSVLLQQNSSSTFKRSSFNYLLKFA